MNSLKLALGIVVLAIIFSFSYDSIYGARITQDGTVLSTVKISDGENGGPVGLQVQDQFGRQIANMGDLNGDGVVDLAVGANQGEATSNPSSGEGAVFIFFMNTDGTVSSSKKISDNENGGPGLDGFDRFGNAVANIGDLNGDGVVDLAVGAPTDEATSNPDADEGALYILFMNSDGTVKSSPAPVKISDSENGGPVLGGNARLGTSIANIGDLNGDGVVDLAVGADLSNAVYILFMNSNGSVSSFVKTSSSSVGVASGDSFAVSVANIGDLNGDGVVDLAVGAWRDEATSNPSSGEGSLSILFMNSDGTVSSSVKISDNENGGPVGLDSGDGFGISVANIGDFNGDGVIDLAVGAHDDESTGGPDREGALYILFMNSDGTVSSNIKIADSENGGPVGLDGGDNFGVGVSSIGDLNGDGFIDLAVGAYEDEATDNPSTNEGALFILFMNGEIIFRSSGGDTTAPTLGKSSTGRQVVEDGFSYQSNLGGFSQLDVEEGHTPMESIPVGVGGIPEAPPSELNDQTRDRLKQDGMDGLVSTFDGISDVIDTLGDFFNRPGTQPNDVPQEPEDLSDLLDDVTQDLAESRMDPETHSNPQKATQINDLLDKIAQKIAEIQDAM